MSAIRRVEAQTRTAGRMVAAGADPNEVVIRIVGMIKTLRAVSAEMSGRHVGHCVSHQVEHGPQAAAVAARAPAEAIGELVQS